MIEDCDTILYKKVKNLYEQAKTIWKGVLFEILLDPIYPEPGEIAGRHIIDYQDWLSDFEAKDEEEVDRDLTLDELFSEIDRLQDYKNILRSALECIEIVKERLQNKYTVTLLRIIDHSNQVDDGNEEIINNEADSESEIETDVEANDVDSDAEYESMDSGVESPTEFDQESEVESEVDYESDSGLQTESDLEPDELQLNNWQSDSESDQEVRQEPAYYHEYEPSSAEDQDSESDQNEERDGTFEFDPIPNAEVFSGSSAIKRCEDDFIILGPNCTSLPKPVYEAIPWRTATGATSALLLLIFGERALGNSPISGYEPVTFQKLRFSSYAQLKPQALADIYFIICSKYNLKEHEVSSLVETKCADIRIKLKSRL